MKEVKWTYDEEYVQSIMEWFDEQEELYPTPPEVKKAWTDAIDEMIFQEMKNKYLNENS